MVGQERTVSSQASRREPTIVWRNLWPFPRPCSRSLQTSARTSPCAPGCFDDPLGGRVSSESFFRCIDEDNLSKFCIWDLHQPSKNSRPSEPHSGTQLLLSNRLKAASKFQLVSTTMDKLAVGQTSRDWVFVAPTAHVNLTYGIACFAFASFSLFQDPLWGPV